MASHRLTYISASLSGFSRFGTHFWVCRAYGDISAFGHGIILDATQTYNFFSHRPSSFLLARGFAQLRHNHRFLSGFVSLANSRVLGIGISSLSERASGRAVLRLKFRIVLCVSRGPGRLFSVLIFGLRLD